MKILGGETNLNAPISVGSASVVRVFNGDSSNLLVTRKTSGGTTVGTFMVPAGEVVYCEKDYTDTLEGSANLQAANVAFSPMMSFVGQTADPTPTYTYSLSATSVNEGGSFTTTCTTTNVADGTNLYWELSGSGITSGDFSSGALTGTGSVSSNSFTFSHTLAEDLTTEGTETITIKLYSDSGRNTQVGNTVTVTVADTSVPVVNYGVIFDGGISRLQLAQTTDFVFGTGDFTIEAYVMQIEDLYSYSRILHFGSYWNDDSAVGLNFDDGDHAGKITFGSYRNANQGTVPSNGRVLIGTTTVVAQQWYHVAVTRKNGVFRLFVNGNLEATNSSITGRDLETPVNASGQALAIANTVDRQVSEPFKARISNVRIVKGQCLYETDFQPSMEALTTTSQGATASNVKLLCCQNSTATGSTVTPGTITAFGTVTPHDTANPFDGDWGVSFDGNDYLTIEDSTDFDLDSSDFTIECWYRPITNPGWVGLMSQWPNGNYNVTNSWTFEPVGSTLSFYYCNTAGNFYNADGPGSLQTNQWQHCAVTRSGNTINVWLNGSKGSDHTIVGTMQNSTVNVDIGGNVAGSGYANGTISNLRLTKGQALYTSNFTPSTSALTTTSQGATASNVKFLGLNRSILLYADVTPNDIDIGGGDPSPTTSDPYE